MAFLAAHWFRQSNGLSRGLWLCPAIHLQVGGQRRWVPGRWVPLPAEADLPKKLVGPSPSNSHPTSQTDHPFIHHRLPPPMYSAFQQLWFDALKANHRPPFAVILFLHSLPPPPRGHCQTRCFPLPGAGEENGKGSVVLHDDCAFGRREGGCFDLVHIVVHHFLLKIIA